MNELWIKAVYWKLAIFKVVNGTLMVGESALLAAAATSHLFTPNAKEVIGLSVGIALAMQKSVELFLDQTLARLGQGKAPISVGDSKPPFELGK